MHVLREDLLGDQIALVTADFTGIGRKTGPRVVESYNARRIPPGRRRKVQMSAFLQDGNVRGSVAHVIASYAGRRTFTPGELRQGSSQGRRGERVRVEVMREGSVRTLSLPRGPLGVLLRAERRPPSLDG